MWSEKSLISWRSGTQYVAMVTKIVKLILRSTSSRILLSKIKHFWHKLSEVSSFIIFDQNSVECMTSSLGNWHILKPWISLERKEIFENSKQWIVHTHIIGTLCLNEDKLWTKKICLRRRVSWGFWVKFSSVAEGEVGEEITGRTETKSGLAKRGRNRPSGAYKNPYEDL